MASEPAGGHLLVRREGAVATVVINRPAQRNAISYAMWVHAGYQHSGQEVHDLEARLDSLKAEEQALRNNVSGLGDDPLELEAAIRDSKGLVREGETIYRVQLSDDLAL